MANLPEQELWEDGIYQLETTDPVLGGLNGVSNTQPKQLANRTRWLKKRTDMWMQYAYPAWDVSFRPYDKNVVVRYNNKVWLSLADNNTATPGTDSSKWTEWKQGDFLSYGDYGIGVPIHLTIEDLNDVKIPGDYYQNSATNATLERHYPAAARPGSLHVICDNPATNSVSQIYIGKALRQISFRTYNAGNDTWTEWEDFFLNGRALTATTGGFSGQVSIIRDAIALRLQAATAGAACYLAGYDADGTQKYYLGRAVANNDNIYLRNRATEKYLLLDANGEITAIGRLNTNDWTYPDARYLRSNYPQAYGDGAALRMYNLTAGSALYIAAYNADGSTAWTLGRHNNLNGNIGLSSSVGGNSIFLYENGDIVAIGAFRTTDWTYLDARYLNAGSAYTKAESDARYIQNIRLGSPVSMSTPHNTTTNAPSGCVLTGLTLSYDGSTGTHVTAFTYEPVQKFVNGTWTTVTDL